MKLGDAGHMIHSTSINLISLCRAAFTGVTGAVLMLNEMRKRVRRGAERIRPPHEEKPHKTPEVVTMKKSTIVALFTALAVVAGVLGALYVYVIRREKELDEYEELLFSEDFDDDDEMSPEQLEELLADAE